MTRYITNFEDSDVPEFPIGWTRRWDMADNRFRHNSSVEIGTPLFKRRQLRVTGVFQNIAALSFDVLDADVVRNNIEVLFHFKRQNLGSPSEGGTSVFCWTRASGTTAAAAGYRLFMGMADSPFPGLFVQRYAGGAVVATPINGVAFAFSASKNYYVRWSVQDLPGSPTTVQINLKVWADDTVEPAAWTTQATDGGGALYGALGWTGLFGSGNSAAVAAPMLFNFFSVGTNGDTAYKPKTNAEFLTWLDDQTANRVSLFEMQAYGYEATPALRNAQGPADESYASFAGAVSSPQDRFLFTADTPENSFVNATAVTVAVDMNPDDFASLHVLMSKGDLAAVDFCWFFQMPVSGGQGQLQFAWSTTGSDTPLALSTDFIPTAAGVRVSVAAELQLNNGAGGWTVKFWISMDRGRSWGQLGSDVTGAGVTSIFNSTQPVEIGSQQNGVFPFKGKIYRAQTWYGRAISDPTNAIRVTDFYPQKMNSALFQAGTYKSLYTGETYTAQNGVITAKHPSTTALRNCYIANKGFTSQDFDAPSQQFYPPWVTKVPPFSRSMGLALSGQATTGLGTFMVSNPADSTGGVRDKWARIKWKRDYVRQLLGDQTWGRVDFRTVVLGRLGQPTVDESGIAFPMSDLSDSLNEPLQLNYYTSGNLTSKPKPIFVGYTLFVEPPCINTTTQEYQYHDGPTGSFPAGPYVPNLYDNFVRVDTTGGATIASVNPATDTITTTAAHGFAAGGEVVGLAAVPAPMLSGIAYYVIAAGLTAVDFRVSTTPGGAALNLTGISAGGTLSYSPSTHYPSKGGFTLARAPSGRVVGSMSGAIGTEDGSIANIIDWIVFKKFGFPLGFKDTASFSALAMAMPVATYKAAMAILPQQGNVTARDALLRFANGVFCWFGISPDGLLQVGNLSTPSSDTTLNVQTFIESDIKLDSLRETNRMLPVDLTKVPTNYAPHQLTGPANTNDPLFSLGGYSLQAGANLPGSAPLDNYPGAADMRTDIKFDFLFSTAAAAGNMVSAKLQFLFLRLLGIYTMKTRFRAMNLNIGDQIKVTHSKMDFEVFSFPANPSSPDSVDPSQPHCIVLGVETDLTVEDGFPCTVTFFRQVPSYYPTANLN